MKPPRIAGRARVAVGIGAAASLLLLVSGLAARAGEAPTTAAKSRAAGVVHTAPMKANGAGVIVRFQLDDAPAAGAKIPVLLSFDGISDPGGATVRLSVDGGLVLVGTETTRNLPPGQPASWSVEVMAPATGTGYLNVFITQTGSTSATSVPVQVGKPPSEMPASGSLKQGGDGEKILPMKVK